MSRNYIPNYTEVIERKDLKLTIYLYINSKDKPCAISYRGIGAKPKWAYSFKDELERKKYIDNNIEDIEEFMKAQNEEKIEYQNKINIGTVLYSSYGYEQTNISFFQVVEKKGITIKLRQLNYDLTLTGDMCGKVTPIIDSFNTDKIITKRISRYMKFSSYESLHLWEGNPLYKSWYA